MAYRDNVQALCDKLGLQNPIREEDLTIKEIEFTDCAGPEMEGSLLVNASEMNRAGRLFVQAHARGENRLPLEAIREEAAEFFTPELWDDCSWVKRTLVWGMSAGRTALIQYK